MKSSRGRPPAPVSWFAPLLLLLLLALLIAGTSLHRAWTGRRTLAPSAPGAWGQRRLLPRFMPSASPLPGHPPRLAVILDDAGWNAALAAEVERMDMPLTVAVLPGGPQGREIASRLAASPVIEVILHMPMEPLRPAKCPASPCLRLAMTDDEIAAEFAKALDSCAPVVKGVNNHMGSAFTMDADRMRVLLSEVKKRGLFFVDSVTSSRSCAYAVARELGVPAARRQVFLDNSTDPAAIRARIAEAEGIARKEGRAVAIGHITKPATIEALREELPRLQSEGIELVRVSDLLE